MRPQTIGIIHVQKWGNSYLLYIILSGEGNDILKLIVIVGHEYSCKTDSPLVIFRSRGKPDTSRQSGEGSFATSDRIMVFAHGI